MALFSTIGNIISSKSNQKAATKVAEGAQENNEANNALAREVYNRNSQNLSPYMQSGNTAGAVLNDFYGITAQQAPQTQNALAPTMSVPYSNGYSSGEYADYGYGGYPAQSSPSAGNMGYNALAAYATPQPMANTAVPASQTVAPSARDAFSQYIANSDYGFQFDQGANAINSGYAGAGTLQSGAAMQDLERFRQNLQAGYRNDWAQGVANQQGVGLAGASALAGVGNNYVSNVTANNNNAFGTVANATLARAANNPWANALSGIGNSAQQVAGFALGGGF